MVLRSLNTAEEAMKIQQVRVDVLANNLANADTAGFKQVLTQVLENTGGGTGGRATAAGGRGASPPGALPRDAMPAERGTEMRMAVDLRRGPLRQTGRALDLAVVGDGFFAVRDETGREYYTRDGSFHLDGQKRLVTSGGQFVQGTGGPITIEGNDWSIGRDGSIEVDGSTVGNLKLVRLTKDDALTHAGGNLIALAGKVQPEVVPKDEVSIETGQLESSNVSAIDAMVDMIAAQRAFEIQAKVVQSADETLGTSVSQLGRTQR